ncbi:MAG TPA: response regulator [Oligoflexia bacterium]|nr:response regulator [Oligoflexia bacterium]HMP26654.1 response regulator [Oligoflexia bacterium]
MAKILLIDDNLTALDLMDFLFEERGYEVIRSSNGSSALEITSFEAPDIIIVDLMMPNMNGEQFVQRLRAQGVQTPVVAFTAAEDPAIHRKALRAGCDLVLTKPCKPNVLVKHIENLIRK